MIDSGMRQHIETAIKDAERGTRAEFIAVLAHRTDDYAETSLVVGLVAAAIAGIAAWKLLPWPGGGEILTAQFGAFLLGFALTYFTSLGVRLTRRTLREHNAWRLARSIFLQRGLASTEEHCGVMFFVAEGERFVEIVADRGIDRKVDAASWQKVVDAFTAAVRAGEVEKGFIGAIAAIGAILAQHFPSTGDNPNEIPNRLIEI